MVTRIFIAGHMGMVGSAIVRQLSENSNVELLLASRSNLDLTDAKAVQAFIRTNRPDQIYLAAAKVGGIHANNAYPADFIADNLAIQTNIINSAFCAGVRKLLFLGSSCIYPQLAEQPIREEYLLTGALEPTNEPYAVAKIAGIKLCESYNRQHGTDYRCVMPTNLYGSNDNFHPQNSHVIPAMIRRFHEAKMDDAKEVVIWGTGKPMREFLHVDDMAAASLHVINLPHALFSEVVSDPMCSHINVGTGRDVTIETLSHAVAMVVGFKGHIKFDASKPDGAPRKLLDVTLLNSLGWRYSIELTQGLEMTYSWFLTHLNMLRN